MPVNDWPPISAASMVARGVADRRGNLDQIRSGDHARCYRHRGAAGKRRQFGARRTNGERQPQAAVQRSRRLIKKEQAR